MAFTTKAIAAADSWSDAVAVTPAKGTFFNVSIWGTFTATVTLQRSFDAGTTWLDVATYTTSKEEVRQEPEGALYRLGCKTGQFTSGPVNVRLGV